MTAHEPNVAELQARVAQLEASNADLSAQLGDRAGAEPARPRHWGRTTAAVILITIATLLTPIAIIGGWSRVVLTDTDAFVAAYAPLAHDPAVQQYVTAEVVGAIEERVDIDTLVADVMEGISSVLVDRPRAQLALETLEQPAAQGVRSAIEQAASRVVSSDAFAQAWQESLRFSHQAVTAALAGETSAVVITEEGIGLQLGPIIERVKENLTERGFALAARIPAIDRTIVLVSGEQFAQTQVIYRTIVAVGSWLPYVVVALFVAGVLAAVNRRRAALWAAIGFVAAGLIVLAAVAIGRAVAQVSVPASVMSANVLTTFYDTIGDPISDIATATVVLGVVAGVLAWLGGGSAAATRVRAVSNGLFTKVRDSSDSVGLNTGSFGRWLYQYRVGLQVLVAVLAALFLFANRPISAGLVLGTAAVALLVLLVLALLARPQPPAGAGPTIAPAAPAEPGVASAPGEPTMVEPAVSEAAPAEPTMVEAVSDSGSAERTAAQPSQGERASGEPT